MTPLPWEWFQFGSASLQSASASAETRRLSVDGQEIPFRLLRSPAATAPRPVVILLHGMGLTIASFRGVGGYLFETHDLLLPDYSGFSGAGFHAPPSIKAFAETVWRIADACGCERFALAGNSLGGGLCLAAAAHCPERISALLLSNPACFPQALPRMYELVRYPLLGELFMSISPAEKFVGGVEYIGYADKTKFDPTLKRLYVDNMRPLKNRLRLMQIIRQLPANAADLAEASHLRRLGDLRMPVLISWGEQDPLLTPGAGARLAASLPDATLDLYPELAHMPHEEAPDRVGRRWVEFLREHA